VVRDHPIPGEACFATADQWNRDYCHDHPWT
jgi:hypothetical protein